MIQLTVTGDNPAALRDQLGEITSWLVYGSLHVQQLMKQAQFAQQANEPVMHGPATPEEHAEHAAKPIATTSGDSHNNGYHQSEAVPLANPSAADPPPEQKRRIGKVEELGAPYGGKRRGRPPKVAETIEAQSVPEPVVPTIDAIKARVKAIIEAHTARKHPRDACVAYIRKLFDQFGIKLSIELKPEQYAEFWAKSEAYLDGSAPA